MFEDPFTGSSSTQGCQRAAANGKRLHAASRHLVAEILAAQEEDLKRLAWELHESLAQTIAATKIRAEQALVGLDSRDGDLTERLLREIVPLLQDSLDQARRMCGELRPMMLDDIGLAPTISWFCRAFRAAHPDIELQLNLQGVRPDLPDPVKTSVYRVLQGAVVNAARHARARRVHVALRQRTQQIDLVVTDDGCGFDAGIAARSGGGVGLVIMKQRVESLSGTLRVDSAPREGVRVWAHWPLP